MSLKIFHLIFTGFTMLLFLFLGVFYSIRYYSSGETLELMTALISIILASATVFYGKNFIRKYKHLSNL